MLSVRISSYEFTRKVWRERYRYIGVNFTLGLQDCDRYVGDIVIPRIVKPGFCSIHFTVTLAGLKNINRFIENIVLSKIATYIGLPLH